VAAWSRAPCGAALIPLGQAIAVNAFPADRHGQATSLWALGFVTANVLAPSIAGVVIEHLGWNWIFLVPLPLGVLVLGASWALVPRSPRRSRPLDWTGFTALILGVSTLQLMLARGTRLDWFQSNEILVEAVVAAAALYVFVMRTWFAKNPFIDRSLFADSNYNLGVTFIFLIGSVLFLPLLLLSLQLQHIGGYPAIDTGYLLLSRGIGSIFGLLIMSRFRDRTDPRPLLFLGLLFTAFASWSMSRWTVDIRPFDVVWTNLIHGVATGAVWAPLNTLTLSRLSKRVQDQGFAFFYLAFDIGSAIGTAVVIGVHTRMSQVNRAVLAEHVTAFTEQGGAGPLPEAWSLAHGSGLAALEREVSRQATMIAFNDSFMLVGIVLAALIPFIVLFRYRRAEHMAGTAAGGA